MPNKIDINGDNPDKKYGAKSTLAQVSPYIVFTYNDKHNNIINYLNSKYAVGVRHRSTEFLISGIGHGIIDVNNCNSRFV